MSELLKTTKMLTESMKKVNRLENEHERNKENFLHAQEILGEFLAWYYENLQELSQKLDVRTSVELNKVVTKAKMLATKAVLL